MSTSTTAFSEWARRREVEQAVEEATKPLRARIDRLTDALRASVEGGQLWDGDVPIDPMDVLYEQWETAQREEMFADKDKSIDDALTGRRITNFVGASERAWARERYMHWTERTRTWRSADGTVRLLTEMEYRHLVNTLAWLERHAVRLKDAYETNMMHWLDGPLGPHGDVAGDDADMMFDRLLNTEPQKWLRRLPIYRALVREKRRRQE